MDALLEVLAGVGGARIDSSACGGGSTRSITATVPVVSSRASGSWTRRSSTRFMTVVCPPEDIETSWGRHSLPGG
jgi:hypothetical protein